MLEYKHVCLESFGYILPENIVTSIEIERELAPVYERFGVHEGRLEMMTGIRERRFWDEGTLPSDGSTRAGPTDSGQFKRGSIQGISSVGPVCAEWKFVEVDSLSPLGGIQALLIGVPRV